MTMVDRVDTCLIGSNRNLILLASNSPHLDRPFRRNLLDFPIIQGELHKPCTTAVQYDR